MPHSLVNIPGDTHFLEARISNEEVRQHTHHSLANWDSCPTPAKTEAIEYLQVGPTEIRYSIVWTIFIYL